MDFECIKVVGNGVVDVIVGSVFDVFGGDFLYKEVVVWYNR